MTYHILLNLNLISLIFLKNCCHYLSCKINNVGRIYIFEWNEYGIDNKACHSQVRSCIFESWVGVGRLIQKIIDSKVKKPRINKKVRYNKRACIMQCCRLLFTEIYKIYAMLYTWILILYLHPPSKFKILHDTNTNSFFESDMEFHLFASNNLASSR